MLTYSSGIRQNFGKCVSSSSLNETFHYICNRMGYPSIISEVRAELQAFIPIFELSDFYHEREIDTFRISPVGDSRLHL